MEVVGESERITEPMDLGEEGGQAVRGGKGRGGETTRWEELGSKGFDGFGESRRRARTSE